MERTILYNETEKEAQIQLAAVKYFNFYLKDWAENNNLNQNAQEELKNILIDSFLFTEEIISEDEKMLSYDEEYVEEDNALLEEYLLM